MYSRRNERPVQYSFRLPDQIGDVVNLSQFRIGMKFGGLLELIELCSTPGPIGNVIYVAEQSSPQEVTSSTTPYFTLSFHHSESCR